MAPPSPNTKSRNRTPLPLSPSPDPVAATASPPPAGPHQRRPRVSPTIEQRILALSFRYPGHGQDRIARELQAQNIRVSASGVRYVWQRHNLETLEKRVAWLEQQLGERESQWSEDQRHARHRVRNSKLSRSLGAGILGARAADVSRRKHILAIAARLFREQSVEAVSLRDLALHSRIPLGSIYYHFQTKEELFEAVYEEGIRRLTQSIQEALHAVEDPWERLEAACATHLVNLCGGDDFTAVSIPTKQPHLSVAGAERIRQLNRGYEQFFIQLITDLPLADDISPTLLRLELLGAMNWTSVWYRPDKQPPATIARHLVRMLRYGTAGPSR